MRAVGRSKSDTLPTRATVLLLCLVTTVTTAAIAVPLIVAGLRWKDELKPIGGGVSTTGRVVKVITDEGSRKNRVTYRAVVEYADSEGVTHQMTNKAGDEPPYVGEVVQVSYDPADPTRAHNLTTGKGSANWPLGTGIFIIGFSVVVDLIVGVVVWRERRRARALSAESGGRS